MAGKHRVPSRSPVRDLGRDYGKLWLATAISALGDGVTIAAGPLLLSSLTSDPFLIGAAVFVQQAPWMLFSLFSGVFVDRVDRRRLVGLVDSLRGLVMGALAVLVGLGWATVPLIYVAVFLLGTGSTLADNASQALLPTVVPAVKLARANAWLSGARMISLQFVGPPLGSVLFVVAMAVPFGVDATSFLLAATLVLALRGAIRKPEPAPDDKPAASIRREIAVGIRWLWRQRGPRTLAVVMGIMNITYGGAFAAFVLYTRDRLGVAQSAYGSLLAAIAVGGVLGTLLVSRLENRFGPSTLLRTGMIIETLTHLVLAWTTSVWTAAAILVVFGAHATIWSVIGVTLRQRITPTALLGRVASVNFLLTTSGYAIGSLAGGAVAQHLGITAPFWIAFGLMVPLTAVVWPALAPAAFAIPADEPHSEASTTVRPQA